MTRAFSFLLMTAALFGMSACAQECKRAIFTGTITSQEEYSRFIADDVQFRLSPMKDDWGWVVSVGPRDFDGDWTAPVTMPLTGERQYIGTGWGSTAQDKMNYPTKVVFVLKTEDYKAASRLAKKAQSSTRPEAVAESLNSLAKLPTGQLVIRPVTYGKGTTPETLKWMKFKATVIVPASFRSSVTKWTPAACPMQ